FLLHCKDPIELVIGVAFIALVDPAEIAPFCLGLRIFAEFASKLREVFGGVASDTLRPLRNALRLIPDGFFFGVTCLLVGGCIFALRGFSLRYVQHYLACADLFDETFRSEILL